MGERLIIQGPLIPIFHGNASMTHPSENLLRALPKTDECILLLEGHTPPGVPRQLVLKAIRTVIEQERRGILSGGSISAVSSGEWQKRFLSLLAEITAPRLRRVFNASGVVIHTNLGRSVLSSAACNMLHLAGGSYSNLEFDLNTGQRGSRYDLVEDILCDLTGAESALIVNNNAAAVLIALDTLAGGREVIVSRGQLVEIGGSFRIPDIMARSGARLVEVGATNRTHLFDYEDAVTPETSLLLRVHTSNFRVIGFTSEVSVEEMVSLGAKHDLLTMEDLGSGSLIDFSRYGLPREPTVQEIVKAGVDVVTFSGDKLLGGPQAGIIVGRRKIIERIKKNPLNRALRIDKFTLAALESVLREYYDIGQALQNIPTLRMLTQSPQQVEARCVRLLSLLDAALQRDFSIESVSSRVGGGAMPEHSIDSRALCYNGDVSITSLETGLRKMAVPILGRVENGHFVLDLRTVQDREIPELAKELNQFLSSADGETRD